MIKFLLTLAGGFFAGKLYADNGGSIAAVKNKLLGKPNSNLQQQRLAELTKP